MDGMGRALGLRAMGRGTRSHRFSTAVSTACFCGREAMECEVSDLLTPLIPFLLLLFSEQGSALRSSPGRATRGSARSASPPAD